MPRSKFVRNRREYSPQYIYSPTSPSYCCTTHDDDPGPSRKRIKYDDDKPEASTKRNTNDNSTRQQLCKDSDNKSASENRYNPYRRNRENSTNARRFEAGGSNDKQYLSFTFLRKLSKMNSEDCVAELEGKKTQFDQLLNDDFRPDRLVVTIQILANICRASFTGIVTSILSHACSAPFLKSLENYLKNLPFETDEDKSTNKLYWEDKNEFWFNLMQLFKTMTELLPTKARDELISVLRKLNSIIIVTETNQDYKVEDNIKHTFSKILNELDEEINKFEARDKVQEILTDSPKAENPPEDFRSLSVIPTINDLSDKNPYIRPSKLKGAYDSVEHYLDIQFRLLREDFISPLREGIQQHLLNVNAKKYRNTQLRIYRKVTLMNPEVTGDNVGVTVSFGSLKNVDWKHSKRFMFGGLLCLSSDNFNTILFATVANRDEKLLQTGTISIEPCKDTVITRDMYHSNWTMLESKIYFEPYLVVLNAMRQMREENFPMKKYLVDADTATSLPHYLRPDKKYPDDKVVLNYKGFELPMEKNQVWPSPETLKLDDTQFAAFKSALTEEFAVIQGPPGTGKTFIALEIIRALIESDRYWISYGPIVIVCLTNHALDQFLEGILKHTRSIVRVGNRSKNEALNDYTLVNKRRELPAAKKSAGSRTLKMLFEKKFVTKCILSNVERTRLALNYLTTKDAIVPFGLLAAYCNDAELNQLNNYDELLQWLLQDDYVPMKPEIEPGEITDDNRMEIEEDYEIYEAWLVDDELRFRTEFNPERCQKPVFLLQAIDIEIANTWDKIYKYEGPRKFFRFDPLRELHTKINDLESKRYDLQCNLAQHPILTQNRTNYSPNSRWTTYWNWVKLSYESAVQALARLTEDYHWAVREHNEAKQMVDLKVLEQHAVVGFTTTSAARLHSLLRALHAPIVLIEEAAEILESHVVCSLTKNCQHVILIGDHKQLKPKVAVHELGKKYNLNISLFERMVNNRGSCTQLGHQHRMRPEIAKLICPTIYETLYNHQSVLDYPSIMGLEKNVFFLNHDKREVRGDNQETWSNPHEAEFFIAFARHLILQGYKSTEITILCTYIGQLFTLIEERNRYSILKDVRITTIDNYQGEENRIILLSLVRNNKDDIVGFLKEENRVCVALSRAREGLYIMGNMKNLLKKNDVWPKINEVLKDSNAIGNSLTLRCQFHYDKPINVKKASDFEQCPEGGCLQKCNADLPCGHTCTNICHISNREHTDFDCKQACVKHCAENHPCPFLCYQGCRSCKVTVDRQLKCGHTVQISCGTDPETHQCPVEVDAVLPSCLHRVKKPCYLSIDKTPCSQPCENRLPCGHACTMNCHVNNDPDHLQYLCHKTCSKNNRNCTMDHPCKLECYEKCKPCPVLIEKKLSCGHQHNCECSCDIKKTVCHKRIEYEKSCGHKLMVRCSRKDDNCQEKVTKTGPCGHKIKVECYEIPDFSHCSGKCKLHLICGHPCTARCKDPCDVICNTLISQTKPGLCGHIFLVPCRFKDTEADSPALLLYCKEPCKAVLACGHICKGNCGSCKQGRIHKPCGEKCGNIFICGHRCEVPCRQECPPCQKPCEVKCRHSKCNRKCGDPCTPCKEKCRIGCRHNRCTKLCFELCSIKPCMKPCFKILRCKHRCIGFCGEPCPKLCRICDKEKLVDEFFLGHEDEPNARFVLLEDCGHCIESKGLLKWLSDNTDSIQVKTCPRCKTPISKCTRISNEIKTHFKDIQRVKEKIFGDQKKLKSQQVLLARKVQEMKKQSTFDNSKRLKQLLENLDASVALITPEKKLRFINAQEAEAAEIVLNILQDIYNKFKKIDSKLSHEAKSYIMIKNQISMLLKSLPTRGQISAQEIQDIEQELQRLHYMIEICIMESEAYIEHSETSIDQKPYNFIVQKLVRTEQFSSVIEEEIVKDLNELKKSHHVKIVLKNERKMIVKAMGFKQGHWYKCPKGHIYSIGECGGAMQQSRCNECGAAIGGSSHRLTTGNSVATEMDGATSSAWPGGN